MILIFRNGGQIFSCMIFVIHIYIICNYGLEKYLTELTFYQRLVLTKWRLRSNNLPISQCRFILNDNVVCPFCPECIGDEMHYLFNCSFFRTDREKYLSQFLVNDDNIENISNLFNSNINQANGTYHKCTRPHFCSQLSTLTLFFKSTALLQSTRYPHIVFSNGF